MVRSVTCFTLCKKLFNRDRQRKRDKQRLLSISQLKTVPEESQNVISCNGPLQYIISAELQTDGLNKPRWCIKINGASNERLQSRTKAVLGVKSKFLTTLQLLWGGLNSQQTKSHSQHRGGGGGGGGGREKERKTKKKQPKKQQPKGSLNPRSPRK